MCSAHALAIIACRYVPRPSPSAATSCSETLFSAGTPYPFASPIVVYSKHQQCGGIMRQLNGKIAVVTGGSRGLGEGIVRALAAEGATVWAIARDSERLDLLKREVDGVHTLVGDVA